MFGMYWYELKRFIKNHLKFFVIGTLVLALIFNVAQFLLNSNGTGTVEPEEIQSEVEESLFENETRPSYFLFYVEHPDGYVFNNSATIHELFTSDEMFERVEEETGIDIKEIREEIRSNIGYENFDPVRVSVGESNIMSAVFELGDNDKNLEVANFYNNYFLNSEFEMFENNLLYSVAEPQLTGLVEEDEEVTIESDFNYRQLLMNVILGLMVGFFLVVLLALSKEFFSKKLNYAFTYIPEESDQFIVYDDELSNQSFVSHFLATPAENNKLILSELPLDAEIRSLLIGKFNDQMTFDKAEDNKMLLTEETSVAEIDIHSRFKEIVIIVLAGQTSRKWYKMQMSMSKLYNIPVKTIQVNA